MSDEKQKQPLNKGTADKPEMAIGRLEFPKPTNVYNHNAVDAIQGCSPDGPGAGYPIGSDKVWYEISYLPWDRCFRITVYPLGSKAAISSKYINDSGLAWEPLQ